MTILPKRLADRTVRDALAPTGNGILRFGTLPTMLARTIIVIIKFTLTSVW
jgi:hypothetical protein